MDTHIVQWLMQVETKLTRDARRLINSAELLVSPMVVMELEFLFEIQRGSRPWHDIHAKLQPEIGLSVCSLQFARVTDVALSESWTRDPFDRLIVANAKANNLAYLISADDHIRKHYQRTVW